MVKSPMSIPGQDAGEWAPSFTSTWNLRRDLRGTHIDEDFRDSKVADEWFQARYEQKMMAKDLEATKKSIVSSGF
jgi:hypothetical protein